MIQEDDYECLFYIAAFIDLMPFLNQRW